MDRITSPHGSPQNPTVVILMMADEEEQRIWDSHPSLTEYEQEPDRMEDDR